MLTTLSIYKMDFIYSRIKWRERLKFGSVSANVVYVKYVIVKLLNFSQSVGFTKMFQVMKN